MESTREITKTTSIENKTENKFHTVETFIKNETVMDYIKDFAMKQTIKQISKQLGMSITPEVVREMVVGNTSPTDKKIKRVLNRYTKVALDEILSL